MPVSCAVKFTGPVGPDTNSVGASVASSSADQFVEQEEDLFLDFPDDAGFDASNDGASGFDASNGDAWMDALMG